MNHAAELKALKARVAAMETKLASPAPKPGPVATIPGPPRHPGTGDVVVTPAARAADETRQRQRIENEKAYEAAVKAERAARGGRWRDPTGLWRTADGKLASMVDQERAQVEAVMRQRKDEQ